MRVKCVRTASLASSPTPASREALGPSDELVTKFILERLELRLRTRKVEQELDEHEKRPSVVLGAWVGGIRVIGPDEEVLEIEA